VVHRATCYNLPRFHDHTKTHSAVIVVSFDVCLIIPIPISVSQYGFLLVLRPRHVVFSVRIRYRVTISFPRRRAPVRKVFKFNSPLSKRRASSRSPTPVSSRVWRLDVGLLRRSISRRCLSLKVISYSSESTTSAVSSTIFLTQVTSVQACRASVGKVDTLGILPPLRSIRISMSSLLFRVAICSQLAAKGSP
jgi:hypothetical protein